MNIHTNGLKFYLTLYFPSNLCCGYYIRLMSRFSLFKLITNGGNNIKYIFLSAWGLWCILYQLFGFYNYFGTVFLVLWVPSFTSSSHFLQHCHHHYSIWLVLLSRCITLALRDKNRDISGFRSYGDDRLVVWGWR